MLKIIKTEGFLLNICWLANDDALLTFLTPDLGKISVFVSKLARSKKKRAEIDWFRCLDFELAQGRSSYKLKNIQAKTVWKVPMHPYTIFEGYNDFFKQLNHWVPEEKPDAHFYHFWSQFFSVLDLDHAQVFLLFAQMQLLNWSGICPKFDQVRTDVFLNVSTLEFYTKKISVNVCFIPNETRQVMEFLRRSDLPEFLAKFDNLPKTTFDLIATIQADIKKHHN